MTLSASERRLVRLSAAIALGRWDELRTLRRAAPPGEPDRRWREVLLQAHLFAGFPRVVEAASVLGEAGGLGPCEPDELEPTAPGSSGAGGTSGGASLAGGSALFERIYGEQTPGVRAALEGAHPLLARWIAEHAYARVLARAGLAPDRRELCAVAALAAQEQERQLAAHARGAVRLGATRAEVQEMLVEIADLLSPAALQRAHEVIAHFTRDP
jgi:alkylhydroperoxidase/carboxymuconolactone decarboxylase family protein YurZ